MYTVLYNSKSNVFVESVTMMVSTPVPVVERAMGLLVGRVTTSLSHSYVRKNCPVGWCPSTKISALKVVPALISVVVEVGGVPTCKQCTALLRVATR